MPSSTPAARCGPATWSRASPSERRELQVGTPAEVQTPYVNTIPREEQPWFPGDEQLEKRIRRLMRWNAAVMVVYANKHADGIGGHLSSFASSAMLYEVGFNHFFRGKEGGLPGDHVYFQGHAAPGIYARAYLEGRLDESQLDNFRREIGGDGLSSYPHPWLMPDFWEFPTVSMGLGPLNSIYQARFCRYLDNRHLDDTSQSKVWCFLGDGETDEPESLGSISLAGREQLDNLVWVVNCNLQRLDGPVRGNGKIIQELEGVFRGAGWNVIKLIWGEGWDDLLARDVDGVLLAKMNSTLDGEWQRYAVESGAYIREHFFGPDPRLRKLVEHLSDEQLTELPRGGHDYKKIYAAYKAATENRGTPTVILAKTVKGWALGSAVEGRNATHQIKKLNLEQLKDLRHRLHLDDEIPDSVFDGDAPPYYRPAPDSPEVRYLLDRRRALDGAMPMRTTGVRRPLTLPEPAVFEEFALGSGRPGRLHHHGLHPDAPRPVPGPRVRQARRADHPRRSPHLRHGLPVPGAQDLRLPGPAVRTGRRLAAAVLRRGPGRPDPRGGHHRGRVDGQLHRGGHQLRHPRRADGAVLHLLFDVRLPAGRRPHLGRGRRPGQGLPDRRHRRAHDAARRGSSAPGRPQPRAGLDRPDGQGLRPRLRLRAGRHRRARAPPDVRRARRHLAQRRRRLLLPDRLQRELRDAGPSPRGSAPRRSSAGLYRWAPAPEGTEAKATVVFSGTAQKAAREAQAALAERGIGVELWSATSYKALREDALEVERWNRLHPLESPRTAQVTDQLGAAPGPIIAVTDFMKSVPDQIARFVPKRFVPLGTDGFGRSDTREALRRFFETDAAHVEVAVLSALAAEGAVDGSVVHDAIKAHEIDADAADPITR